MSVFSARIKAARAYAGLTQLELADRLGVDEQTIKRRESPGGKEPKKGERIAIAAICGVRPEFIEGTSDVLNDAAGAAIAQIRGEITELRAGLVTLAADSLRRTKELEARLDRDRPSEPGEGTGR